MNKKIFIILGVFIGIAIIGIVLFFVFKALKTDTIKDRNVISFFLPETKEKDIQSPQEKITTETEETQTQPPRQLIQIINTPTTGAVFNKQSNKVNYVEKTTGHLYETNQEGGEKKQLTLTTIPKTFKVLGLQDSSGIILRYLRPEKNDIQTLLTTNTPTTTPKEIEGVFLPLNVLSITNSPEENKIFYLINENNQTKGISATNNNKNQKEIFKSYFKDFLAAWPQKNIITIQTKPSAFKGGYLYKLNPTTTSFIKLLENINGLTTLYFPSEEKILYNQSVNKTFTTKIYNIKEKSSSSFLYTTLPEKCIFSKKNTNILYCAVPKNIPLAYYPDDWYKGKISFNDVLWKIDLKNGATKIILEKEGFDFINLFTNTEENYLFFQNKKDSTLWSLNLTISN